MGVYHMRAWWLSVIIILLASAVLMMAGCGGGGSLGSGGSTGSASDGTQNGRAKAPVLAPQGGSFTKAQSVVITSDSPGTTIYYTVDGSTPNSGSKKYSSPVKVLQSVTVKAKAAGLGYTDSDVASADFSFPPNNSQGSALELEPTLYEDLRLNGTDWYRIRLSSGNVLRVEVIFSSGTPSLKLFDTANVLLASSESGTTTTGRLSYNVRASGDFLFSVSETKSAKGRTGTSAKETVTYKLTVFTNPEGQVAAPVYAPQEGEYRFPLTVSLSTTTDGAEMFYSTDGSAPSMSSTKYSGPFDLSSSSTVKAFAVKAGLDDSTVTSATYTASVTPSPSPSPSSSPTSSPGGGSGGGGGGGGGGGTGGITGIVVDEAQQPIAGAQVSLDYQLKGTKQSGKVQRTARVPLTITYSDSNGHYSFTDVATGYYTVTGVKTGYILNSVDVTVAKQSNSGRGYCFAEHSLLSGCGKQSQVGGCRRFQRRWKA